MWRHNHQNAFDEIQTRLSTAPVLALSNHDAPFHVVCDASDFAIGCALMQHNVASKERVVSYQSRQLKPAERNYPVHDKELLAMRYALVSFVFTFTCLKSIRLLSTQIMRLCTATKIPHFS